MAIVSIKAQRVSLYDANGRALRARVSTGRTDYETPVGIYSVLAKQEEHYSNVYDDAGPAGCGRTPSTEVVDAESQQCPRLIRSKRGDHRVGLGANAGLKPLSHARGEPMPACSQQSVE